MWASVGRFLWTTEEQHAARLKHLSAFSSSVVWYASVVLGVLTLARLITPPEETVALLTEREARMAMGSSRLITMQLYRKDCAAACSGGRSMNASWPMTVPLFDLTKDTGARNQTALRERLVGFAGTLQRPQTWETITSHQAYYSRRAAADGSWCCPVTSSPSPSPILPLVWC